MTYERYRERVPPYDSSFLGNKKGVKHKAGDKLGEFREYRNSKVFFRENLLLTGTPKDSYTSERTWDELHPQFVRGRPRDLAKLDQDDSLGGPFANVKVVLPTSSEKGPFTYRVTSGFPAGQWWEVESSFLPENSVMDSTPFLYNSFRDTGPITPFDVGLFPSLSQYSQKAYDLTRPKVEKASAAQFFYELRDLPGMLRTSAHFFKQQWENTRLIHDLPAGARPEATRRVTHAFEAGVKMLPKEAADHFLNHNFGWVPFINDLTKFFDTYQRTNEYVEQLTKSNGNWQGRRAAIDHVITVGKIGNRVYSQRVQPSGFRLDSVLKPVTVDGISCTGFCDITQTFELDVWAKGSFKVYIPEFDDNLLTFGSQVTSIGRLLRIYGAHINPSLIWRITPWTWLVDWFVSIGRNIDIINDQFFDKIPCRYLYLMGKSSRRIVSNHMFSTWQGWHSLNWERSLSTKQRILADSPFGFDLRWDQLTPKQWAILGAIGITRSNFG